MPSCNLFILGSILIRRHNYETSIRDYYCVRWVESARKINDYRLEC